MSHYFGLQGIGITLWCGMSLRCIQFIVAEPGGDCFPAVDRKRQDAECQVFEASKTLSAPSIHPLAIA